jgi:hypothetical protein
MPESHLRAADADRMAVASVLGEHMAAGRLTVEEYDDRLARAYAAKTYGELDELTVDLPSTPPARPVATSPVAQVAHHGRAVHPDAWQAWLRTGLIVLTIWAVTCVANWQFLYFWPVWVIGPWGAVLLAQTISGGGRDRSRNRRRRN